MNKEQLNCSLFFVYILLFTNQFNFVNENLCDQVVAQLVFVQCTLSNWRTVVRSRVVVAVFITLSCITDIRLYVVELATNVILSTQWALKTNLEIGRFLNLSSYQGKHYYYYYYYYYSLYYYYLCSHCYYYYYCYHYC